MATERPLSCEWGKPEKTNIHPPLSPKFSQNCTFRDNREVFTSLSNPLGTLEQQRLRRSSSSCSWRTSEELCQIREYVGASICIGVTKPSQGRTIGSSGFMGGWRRLGGGVGATRCTNGMPLFAGASTGCNQIYRADSRERITNQNRSFLGKLPKA